MFVLYVQLVLSGDYVVVVQKIKTVVINYLRPECIRNKLLM